ncbi:probable mediator of RNA polymerase II transcription subunit 26c isoform X2 [Salvia miltiorrhiza]|uniref:probable mediator of RNA polymerase II transcription subunit 26c isoform X2 n=1 Tax=Salvia miltiorrhiza TaxID=226208 RepID=UPI0025AD411E|nr:probable mediator of RNA polymerase II transcription subunit 26c isoform X2 [Salvia miltiorrhiza]
MDSDEFRAILSRSGVGIWALIDAAIGFASSDYGDELRSRRDGIVESLYAPAGLLCRNCGGGTNDCGDADQDHRFCNRSTKIEYSSDDVDHKDNNFDSNKKSSVDDDRNLNADFGKTALTPESNHLNLSGGNDEGDADPYAGLFDDDEQTTIFSIKEQLEDPHQSEEAVVELLQTLEDMDITFQALEDTDIGRHVNRLRKHSSSEVRRLVKQLIRKWKETVDEWVKVNQPQATTANLIADVDSPQQNIPKNQQNGHHQVPDFGYSPNPRNGAPTPERNYVEYESKPKPSPSAAARRETPSRPPQSASKSSSAPPPNRAQRETVVDDEKLNSARRRLQENYQEAQNAKKQRTIQMMDIHEIPKPKNTFFAKNKGGFQGRHHR